MDIDRPRLVRRLLGAATDLFLRDSDPIVVHCLASAAAEHAELLAQDAGRATLKAHVRGTFPSMTDADFKRLRNQNWTVIKHAKNRRGVAFDVASELREFDDSYNDAILFAGWHDYQQAGKPLPVEAQALQVWFFNMYPNSVDPARRQDVMVPGFESLPDLERIAQKRALLAAIENARNDQDLLSHPLTDPRALDAW